MLLLISFQCVLGIFNEATHLIKQSFIDWNKTPISHPRWMTGTKHPSHIYEIPSYFLKLLTNKTQNHAWTNLIFKVPCPHLNVGQHINKVGKKVFKTITSQCKPHEYMLLCVQMLFCQMTRDG